MDTMEILSVWRTYLEATLAPKTAYGYYMAVMRFVTANPMPLVLVTEHVVAQWIEGMEYRSAKRSTYFHALKHLFAFMVRKGYIERDPTEHIHVAAPEEKEPRALSVEEYEAVRDAAYEHARVRGLTVELFYFTGGRLGEVCSLTWEQIGTEGITFRKTKGGKERLIPWDTSGNLRRVVEGLRDLFGERERVLPRAQGTVQEWLAKAGRDAGVPKVHPHLLRSTAATRAQERGVRITAVQRFLGHSKVSTTMRYSAITREEVRQVADSLG